MTTARFTSLAAGAAAAEYPPGSYPVTTSGWRPGGGTAPVHRHDACLLGQTQAFWVMSDVSARRPG